MDRGTRSDEFIKYLVSIKRGFYRGSWSQSTRCVPKKLLVVSLLKQKMRCGTTAGSTAEFAIIAGLFAPRNRSGVVANGESTPMVARQRATPVSFTVGPCAGNRPFKITGGTRLLLGTRCEPGSHDRLRRLTVVERAVP